METLSADVAVVGGSLAGSAAALALAKAGREVIVLEKASFPRPRICGELLSVRAAEELDAAELLGEVIDAGAERITRFSVVGPTGGRVDGKLPRPVLSLSRERLDALVAAGAARAGARVLFGRTVTGISGDLTSGFAVEAPDLLVRARAVLGAWGRYGPLDGRLGRPFFGKPATLFGFKKHFKGSSAHLDGRVVLHLFAGGYLGLSRVEGGAVNLAALATTAMAREAREDLDVLLRRLTHESRALARDMEGLVAEPGPVLLSEPVLLAPRDPLAGDVLLAGDAAGLLDPWTGRGMGKALSSGRLAAEALEAFLGGAAQVAGAANAADVAVLKSRHERDERRLARGDFLRARLLRPVFDGRAAGILHPAASPLARLLARWVAA